MEFKKAKKKVKRLYESCLERAQRRKEYINVWRKAGHVKHSAGEELQSLKIIVDIDNLIVSGNGDIKIRQPIRIASWSAMKVQNGTSSASSNEHLPK